MKFIGILFLNKQMRIHYNQVHQL